MGILFEEIPIDEHTKNYRKLISGVGINDAEYKTSLTIDGGQIVCPYYHVWLHIIHRCYSEKYNLKIPTYNNCIVSDDWLFFSNFKQWMEKQEWKNKEIDKDILYPNNSVYSEKTCIFVSQNINKLFNNNNKKISKGYPTGVSINSGRHKFRATYSNNGHTKHIGYYDTIQEAEQAYLKCKSKYVLKLAENIEDIKLKQALINRANLLIK